MARLVVTGSVTGLGRDAAANLLDDGHEVVIQARSRDRLSAAQDLVDRGAVSVIGDLSNPTETRRVAEQVNKLPRSTR
jgi:short-subunit dehydrogenase